MCKGSQQRQQSTQKPPEYVKQAYKDIVGKASKVAERPYEAYGGQLVAGLTGNQQNAFNAIQNAQGIQEPYLQNANQLSMAGSAAINPMAFSAEAVNQYLNPYLNNVMDATLANINNQNAIQRQGIVGNQIAKGAFGGDRAGVAQAELARNQALAQNQTIAQLRSDAYNQALGMFNTQQQVGLSAQQNTAARQMQGAQLQAGLGGQAQSQALAGANALLQAGSLEQQQRQNELNSQYQQWQNKQAYPFQSLGWLGNIVTGVGNNAGGTTTTTTSPPSLLSGMIGLGTAALGAVSDRRAKTGVEPIGETYDGQQIYRFQYHGDPETRIGLMAQDVEHAHPEAVGRIGDLKTVDYDAATRDAADRGQFAAGGGVGVLPYGAMEGSSYIPVSPFVGGRGANMPAAPAAPGIGAQTGTGAAGGILPAGTTSSDWTKLGQSARTAYDKMTTGPNPMLGAPSYGGLYGRGGVVPGYDEGGAVEYDILGNPITQSQPSATVIPFPKSDRGVLPVAGPDRGVNYAPPAYGPTPDARRVTTEALPPDAGLPRPGTPILPPVPERVGPAPALAVGGDRAAVPATVGTQFGQFAVRDDGTAQTRMPDTAAGVAMRANQRAAGDVMLNSPAVAAARGVAPALPATAAVDAADRGVAPPLRPRADVAAAAQRNRGVLDTAGVAAPPTPLAAPETSTARRFLASTGITPAWDRMSTALATKPTGGTYDPSPIGRALGMDNAWFSPETRSALIAAGLGIMGGTSRNAFVNIGQGGLQGITQYNAATGQNQAQQKIDIEQKRLDQERMLRERELDISQQGVTQSGMRSPGYYGNPVTGDYAVSLPGAGGGYQMSRGKDGTPAPVQAPSETAAATATPLPAAGTPAAPGPQAVTQPVAPVVPQKRTAAEIAGLIREGKDPIMSGPPVPPVVPVDPRSVGLPSDQQLFVQQNQEALNRRKEAIDIYNSQKPRYEQIEHALKSLPEYGWFASGASADQRRAAAAALADFGRVTGFPVPGQAELEKNLSMQEELNKVLRQAAGEIARTGGQEAFSALDASLKQLPTSQLTRQGALRIINAQQQMLQRQRDFVTYMDDYQQKNQNGANLRDAESRFNTERPPELYVKRAIVMSLPPAMLNEAFTNGLWDKPGFQAQLDKQYGAGTSDAVKQVYGLK